MKVDIVKRGKVRRNYLTYLRKRQGKATRLTDLAFDRAAANVQSEIAAPTPEAKTDDKVEFGKSAAAKTESKAKKPTTQATAKAGKPTTKPPAEAKAKPSAKADDKKAKAEEFRQKHQG